MTMEHISTTAIADVLALHGRRGWLSPPLVEFAAAPKPIRGMATTVTMAPGPDPQGGAFEQLYARLDGDLSSRVIVIGGASEVQGAVWGQILSRAARRAGAAGAVIDGCVRDRAALAAEGLPVWGRRECMVGAVGLVHVAALDEPVTVVGVKVRAGDSIIGDHDGTVVLADDLAEQLLAQAHEYDRAEAALLADLASGVSLVEAYEHKRRVVRRIVGGAHETFPVPDQQREEGP
jgi:4-hydroxy-4-methyl-2-oxoglutarate aldolase